MSGTVFVWFIARLLSGQAHTEPFMWPVFNNLFKWWMPYFSKVSENQFYSPTRTNAWKNTPVESGKQGKVGENVLFFPLFWKGNETVFKFFIAKSRQLAINNLPVLIKPGVEYVWATTSHTLLTWAARTTLAYFPLTLLGWADTLSCSWHAPTAPSKDPTSPAQWKF